LKHHPKNIDLQINEEFIHLLKKGDHKSLEFFYDQFASSIYTTILRYTSNIHDAEDLLQDTLIKIIESLKKFQYTNEKMFRAWLIKIAINTSLSFIRNEMKFDNIDNYSLDIISESDPYYDEDNFYNELTHKELFSLIAELPIGYKTVFNLFVIENYSHKEIATELGITESTSKTQLLKARKLLKLKIQKKYSSTKIYEYGKV